MNMMVGGLSLSMLGMVGQTLDLASRAARCIMRSSAPAEAALVGRFTVRRHAPVIRAYGACAGVFLPRAPTLSSYFSMC